MVVCIFCRGPLGPEVDETAEGWVDSAPDTGIWDIIANCWCEYAGAGWRRAGRWGGIVDGIIQGIDDAILYGMEAAPLGRGCWFVTAKAGTCNGIGGWEYGGAGYGKFVGNG